MPIQKFDIYQNITKKSVQSDSFLLNKFFVPILILFLLLRPYILAVFLIWSSFKRSSKRRSDQKRALWLKLDLKSKFLKYVLISRNPLFSVIYRDIFFRRRQYSAIVPCDNHYYTTTDDSGSSRVMGGDLQTFGRCYEVRPQRPQKEAWQSLGGHSGLTQVVYGRRTCEVALTGVKAAAFARVWSRERRPTLTTKIRDHIRWLHSVRVHSSNTKHTQLDFDITTSTKNKHYFVFESLNHQIWSLRRPF